MSACHPYQDKVETTTDGDSALNSGLSKTTMDVGGVGKWSAKAAPVKAACLSCRQKKAKCDGQQPVCGQVRELNDFGSCTGRRADVGDAATNRIHYSAPKKAWTPPPSALSEYLKRLDDLATVPMRVDLSHGSHDQSGEDSSNVVRVCSSRDEVLSRYYEEIHPFISVMPPRDHFPQVLSALKSESPFLLAAQTILALVPHPNDDAPRSVKSKQLRQCASQAFARQCLHLTECLIEQGKADLECVQALVIISLWEWSNSGNVARNRLRAGQSVQVAMDIGLHDMDKYPTGRKVEGTDWKRDMARRTWWVVYNSQLISSVVSGTAPLLGPDDVRIRVDFPVCSFDDFTWPNYTETLRQCARIFTLVNTVYYAHFKDGPQWGYVSENITTQNKADMRRQMLDVDQQINVMLKQAEETNVIDMVPGGEEEVVRNQQLSARLALAVVHIHIHRNQAFPEVSLFSKRICGLPQAPDVSSTPSLAIPAQNSASHLSCGMVQPEGVKLHSSKANQGIASMSMEDNCHDFPRKDMPTLSPQRGSPTYNVELTSDLWIPELYPSNIPLPWFTRPHGAAALFAPVESTPQFYDIIPNFGHTTEVSFSAERDVAGPTTPPSLLQTPHVSASILPINTPASSDGRAPSLDHQAHEITSVTEQSNKSHKAWGVDEKADKVLPPPNRDVLDIFPPGISLARCATAAHTIVRLEVLHRSAMMAMWKGPQSHSEEIEALMTNVKVILAGLEAYGVMWAGIDAMADEVRAALEAASKLPHEVQAQIEMSPLVDKPSP
ncbi:hypothetical protein IAT38_006117 [Cryptococcus sp. DSM 104549]